MNCLGSYVLTTGNTSIQAWLDSPNTNYRDVKMAASVLNNNGCSTESQELVLQAIEALSNEEVESFQDIVVFVAPDDPIENMVEFLLCIDIDAPASLTIYADQPINDSTFPVDIETRNPGHAFISLSQNENTVVFGFYPKTKAKAALLDQGAIGNNQNDEYDASITTNITPEQLLKIIEYAIVKPAIYNVNHFNCTDYAIKIGNLGGLNLPNCYSPLYPGGGGSAPSILGEYIKSLPESDEYTTETTTNNAPSQSGDCD